MPDLETLLRDVRPDVDPDWGRRLDTRVAARFPAPPSRWKAPLIAMRDHFIALSAVGALATVIVGFVVVAGLSTQSGDDSGDTPTAMSASAPESAQTDTDSGVGSGEDASGGSTTRQSAPTVAATPAPSASEPLTRDRAVLRSASITLSTRYDKVESIVDRAIRVVDGLGGFVGNSAVNASGTTASATLTLQIPSGKLDSGLAQLSRLAHVKSRSQEAQDVTDQRSALEAAVRDARADRDGLRARLAKATTDKERSRLRALLDRASRRVTQRERRVAELGRAVSYATVELSVEGTRRSGAVVPGDRWTPGDAVGDAGRVLEVVAGVLVIGAAILFPVGIVALLAVLAGRVMVRRRRERALESA